MTLDCLIIGGGPAGLAAAVYLARFRRKMLLVDAGEPRADLVPLSHNCPGFPDGISGPDLVAHQRAQAARYGAEMRHGLLTGLSKRPNGTFSATYEDASGRETALQARTVILATGVVDDLPKMPDVRQALRAGRLRHCPVCDGFEAIDQRIAVIGSGAGGLGEATFLRTYSADVTLFTLNSRMKLTEADRTELRDESIKAVETPITRVAMDADAVVLCTDDEQSFRFDTLYSALGGTARSELATMIGAEFGACAGLVTDTHQETSIPGLYAIGDVVDALNQIAVGWGHAAIAATHIHNRLKDQTGAPPPA